MTHALLNHVKATAGKEFLSSTSAVSPTRARPEYVLFTTLHLEPSSESQIEVVAHVLP